MAFVTAKKESKKARIAFMGPAGSGKTYSALLVAAGLGSKIAVIDTEDGSANLYAGEAGIPEFSIQTLSDYNPKNYMAAIKEAEDAGFDVLIIDSLSHAWNMKGGILEIVDKGSQVNKFGNWKDASPIQNQFVDTILKCKCHVIATMRAKMDYVLEVNGKGQNVPKKVGLAPVQRDGMEYEFDVVGMFDNKNNMTIVKTRMSAINEAVIEKPNKEFGLTIANWLKDGVPAQPKPVTPPAPAAPPTEPTITAAQTKARVGLLWKKKQPTLKPETAMDDFKKLLAEASGTTEEVVKMNPEQLAKLNKWLDEQGV